MLTTHTDPTDVAATMAVPIPPPVAHPTANGTWQVTTPTGLHPEAPPRHRRRPPEPGPVLITHADPTGEHAVAVDVPTVDTVAATLAVPVPPVVAHPPADGGWQTAMATGLHPVARPRPLTPTPVTARLLGADTAAVLQDLASC